MVGATGFEPATSCSQSKCSSQAELRSDRLVVSTYRGVPAMTMIQFRSSKSFFDGQCIRPGFRLTGIFQENTARFFNGERIFNATSHNCPGFPSLKILQHQETRQAASDRTADQLHVRLEVDRKYVPRVLPEPLVIAS